MNTKSFRLIIATALALLALPLLAADGDTIWVRYDNRFKPNASIPAKGADSIEVTTSQLRIYTNGTPRTRPYGAIVPLDGADMMFTSPGRYLLKPSTYSGTNYENAAAKAGYNFAHSVESEHFAVFWDAQFGNDPTRIKHPNGGDVANAYNVLDVAEKCWQVYAGELGFVVPGKSSTDKYKIQLYIPYQSEWRADASGTDGQDANGTWGQTGIGHFTPWAANARGGHTIAHEVGHTFQYLVSADLGTDHGWRWGFNGYGAGDCGWWESCADWQAYQIFPERQFTDGEYFEQHLNAHYLNLLHEDWRYACCYIQDWWTMKHGRNFIGRMWRESKRPEDPVQAYKRILGLTQDEFCDEQMEGYMRMATWDIDGVRTRAQHRIGQHKTWLRTINAATATYQADVDHCIQNYGYHIINMSRPAAGTVVKANFTGLTDAAGYRYVYPERAGWRYAFVAMQKDGTRLYGEVQRDKEGTAQLTIPENCTRLFFVVMGAPTQHWQHPWDRNVAASSWAQNGEQWPYQVQFEQTKPTF
ncbi:MAG: hypothetical protein IJ841_01810 [Prevotella sp.]|nr:hypothetical protein [Prevotella sp.]